MNNRENDISHNKVKPVLLVRLGRILVTGTLIFGVFLLAGFGYTGWDGLWITWIQNILITGITWETLEWSIHKLDRLYPWKKQSVKRFIIQALLVPCVSALTVGIPMYLFYRLATGSDTLTSGFRIMLIIGVLISLLVSTILSAMDFYSQSIRAALQVELLKEEQLKSQLESLRQQVNPHFLFNSLNVLHALIPSDTEKAQAFVLDLSRVYRYVLDAGKSELMSIKEELDFLKAYSSLLQQRFGDALIWDIRSDEAIQGRIPGLSLQLLVENAVKHNIVSRTKPLRVEVVVTPDAVYVRNNLQIRQSPEPSTGLGLENILLRYRLAGYAEPDIRKTETHFEVILPLLPSE